MDRPLANHHLGVVVVDLLVGHGLSLKEKLSMSMWEREEALAILFPVCGGGTVVVVDHLAGEEAVVDVLLSQRPLIHQIPWWLLVAVVVVVMAPIAMAVVVVVLTVVALVLAV